jgi:Transketolase, pyrimidine binding domain
MRKAFIQAVRSELSVDPAIQVFLGDISVAGFLNASDELIERVHNCGILEQAMVSFAAGCSVGGQFPIVQTIIPFLVERAFEQIKLDFCAQRNPGLLVGVGGGLEYSKLGYTHHTLWDTALLGNLAGLSLFTPTVGAEEVKTILPLLIRNRTLAYARLTECYLKAGHTGPYSIHGLVPVKQGSDRSRAKVICGAYPGIQSAVDEAGCDVFAYSFPNAVPADVDLLRPYSSLEVWEFGTAPMLHRRLAQALPATSIRGFCQGPEFFRAYGDDAAARFIASNWVASL